MTKTLNDVFGSVGADAKLVAQVKANTKDIVSLNRDVETKVSLSGGLMAGQLQLRGGSNNTTGGAPLIVDGDGGQVFPTIGFHNPAKFLGASLTARAENEISVMSNNGVDFGRLHTGFINVHGKNDAISFQGGQINSNNSEHLQLNGNRYAFLTSPSDVHLCNNSYWNGVDWLKHDNSKASSYIVLSGSNAGSSNVPVLRYSDAGNTNANQHAGYFYGQFNKPRLKWRLVKDGSWPWHVNEYFDFQVDMRNRMVMFEVSHNGGGSTTITCTNDGSAWMYWVYGSWEYQFEWVNPTTLRMRFFTGNTGSPIYRVWIEDYE